MEKKNIYQVLADVINDIEAVKKTESNPFYKSKYTPLPELLDGVKPILAKHNALIYYTINGNTIKLNFTVATIEESLIYSELNLLGITDMQKLGSAITYARRYLLTSFLNIAEVDDDGNDSLPQKPEMQNNEVKPANKDKYNKEHTELIKEALEIYPNDTFLLSIAENYKKYGKLTDKQKKAVENKLLMNASQDNEIPDKFLI